MVNLRKVSQCSVQQVRGHFKKKQLVKYLLEITSKDRSNKDRQALHRGLGTNRANYNQHKQCRELLYVRKRQNGVWWRQAELGGNMQDLV